MSVRCILSLLIFLVGLLTAHQFMKRSNELLSLKPADSAEHGTIAVNAITVNEITVNEPRAAAAATTECEQTWDLTTHMTKEEWSQACRRVDDDRQLP